MKHDLAGRRFGALEAKRYIPGTAPHFRARWECVCDCGRVRVAAASDLMGGKVTNCGCLKNRAIGEARRKNAQLIREHNAPNRVSADGVVQLTRGLVALVDPEDVPLVSPFFWKANKSRRGYYACRSQKPQMMHVLIMGERADFEIDHANGNKLDNRRSNLRWATREQNQANRPGSTGRTSKYKGVCWRKRERRWYASIRFKGVVRALGTYLAEDDAARAYDRAARELHGQFAVLNFPEAT